CIQIRGGKIGCQRAGSKVDPISEQGCKHWLHFTLAPESWTWSVHGWKSSGVAGMFGDRTEGSVLRGTGWVPPPPWTYPGRFNTWRRVAPCRSAGTDPALARTVITPLMLGQKFGRNVQVAYKPVPVDEIISGRARIQGNLLQIIQADDSMALLPSAR